MNEITLSLQIASPICNGERIVPVSDDILTSCCQRFGLQREVFPFDNQFEALRSFSCATTEVDAKNRTRRWQLSVLLFVLLALW